MIRITSTLIVHRPERLLYYLPEMTPEVEKSIAEGVYPEALKKYQYAYGTYDDIGVFYLSEKLQSETGMKRVVGIEYRKDDNSLELPAELPSVILPASSMIIQDVTYEYGLNEELLEEIIDYVCTEKNDRMDIYRYVEKGMICVFAVNGKLRIGQEVERTDETRALFEDNLDNYTKEELYYRAYHEPITEYYNWTWMRECLEKYYLEGVRDYGFVHFDIKEFKMINELYNHRVANDVLKRVAKNMQKHRDWIYFGARCDNDNFAMMIKVMPDEETEERLIRFFEEISYLNEDPQYEIFYRCGVVSMRYAMNTGEIVADCAKLAQSMGQKMNTTEIHFYTNEMHENALWGKQLKAYLDTAIRADEFMVYLQPKMDTYEEKICGAEALIRWNYKHKEMLAPYRFIPHFETDESIIKIDEFVLHRVCAKLREWKEKGYPLYPISVNLSRRHMVQPYMARHLAAIVDAYGVDRSLIEFEITETIAYENQAYMIFVLNDLKRKGFRISMDDFGTGYSSFSLLKEMPLDTLKIDKSFVDLIMKDEDNNKITIILHHIVTMAEELGISSIAEGVEEYEQVEALREWGCEMVQGYYYSKPVPIREFEKNYLE